MPTLFLSHGSPLLAILDSSARQFLQGLGSRLPRPSAVVVLSAHQTRSRWRSRAVCGLRRSTTSAASRVSSTSFATRARRAGTRGANPRPAFGGGHRRGARALTRLRSRRLDSAALDVSGRRPAARASLDRQLARRRMALRARSRAAAAARGRRASDRLRRRYAQPRSVYVRGRARRRSAAAGMGGAVRRLGRGRDRSAALQRVCSTTASALRTSRRITRRTSTSCRCSQRSAPLATTSVASAFTRATTAACCRWIRTRSAARSLPVADLERSNLSQLRNADGRIRDNRCARTRLNVAHSRHRCMAR